MSIHQFIWEKPQGGLRDTPALFFCWLTEGRRTKGSQSWLDFSFNITADFYGPFDSDLRVDIQRILDRDVELVFDSYICLHWCFDLTNGDWTADR